MENVLNGVLHKKFANLTKKQRITSSIAGAVLVGMAIGHMKKDSSRKWVELAAGGLLLARGLSGYCPMTSAIEKVKERAKDFVENAESEYEEHSFS